MNNQFHRNLNRMTLFSAFVLVVLILFRTQFLDVAITNVWLNGVIIGSTIFGIGLCFVDMFKLLPEYRWMRKYFRGERNLKLPPKLLRPVAIILGQSKNGVMSASTLHDFLNIIISRFEDQRDTIRYITNTLVFLGLLGTFWGLINTIGGFSELIKMLNFDDENVMNSLQSGLTKPLAGMGVAFTSSLFGMTGSLIVGFLGLQVQLAQNTIFRELEENLSQRSKILESDEENVLSSISRTAERLANSVENLERSVSKIK